MYKIYSWNKIFTYCPNDFWHKIKICNFEQNNVFLAIATNIPQRLTTGFVLQGHNSEIKSRNYFCFLIMWWKKMELQYIYNMSTQNCVILSV